MMTIRFIPEAECDLRLIYEWYYQKGHSLAGEFLKNFESALLFIVKNPEASSTVHQDVRRCLMKRFPYAIFYLIEEKKITVLGVFHCRRKPWLWKKRR